MRHRVDGRRLGRSTEHRKALFRNLANSVIEKEQVITTLPKAKETRRVVDRLISLGKRGSPHARRVAFGRTRNKIVVGKLFGPLSERYRERPGGYTRVVKLSERRRGDGAELAVLELVDRAPINRKKQKSEGGEQAQAASSSDAQSTEGVEGDPFAKFRKLFKGKSKKKQGTQ